MNKELTEELRPVGQDYFVTLTQWIRDNNGQAIENPLDEYLTYGSVLSDELNRILNECEGDDATIGEIESYFARITESVENHEDIPSAYTGKGGYHGGGRKKRGSGRVSMNISGTKEELDLLRQKAKEQNMTVSAFVLSLIR